MAFSEGSNMKPYEYHLQAKRGSGWITIETFDDIHTAREKLRYDPGRRIAERDKITKMWSYIEDYPETLLDEHINEVRFLELGKLRCPLTDGE